MCDIQNLADYEVRDLVQCVRDSMHMHERMQMMTEGEEAYFHGLMVHKAKHLLEAINPKQQTQLSMQDFYIH